MKNMLIKRLIIYMVTLTIIGIIGTLLEEITAGVPLGGFAGIGILLWLCVLLVDIGWLIKNKQRRKKYIVYIGIFVGQIAIMSFISAITGVGTGNTWLGAIGASIMALTAVVMMFKTAKSIKRTRPLVAKLLYFFIFLTVTAVIVTNIAFFAGAFTSY